MFGLSFFKGEYSAGLRRYRRYRNCRDGAYRCSIPGPRTRAQKHVADSGDSPGGNQLHTICPARLCTAAPGALQRRLRITFPHSEYLAERQHGLLHVVVSFHFQRRLASAQDLHHHAGRTDFP